MKVEMQPTAKAEIPLVSGGLYEHKKSGKLYLVCIYNLNGTENIIFFRIRDDGGMSASAMWDWAEAKELLNSGEYVYHQSAKIVVE